MTKTITAKALAYVQFTINDTISSSNVLTSSNSTQNAANYTYGTGNFQVTDIVNYTGVLNSGESLVFDLQAFPAEVFGISYDVNFSKIKCITIQNSSTYQGSDLSIRATGVNPLDDIFNGGSGNILVKPYSSYIYNDPYGGITISGSNSKISLHDHGGSGAGYSITILGMGT